MTPLSREFLLARGFCCNLGCLNCPYKKEEVVKEYKPIQENATKVRLTHFSCDEDCCGVITFDIRSDKGLLWQGPTLYCIDYTKEELEEARQEIKDACKYYGIEPIDIDEDCVFDWEGERIL